jgi:hypothetical protein
MMKKYKSLVTSVLILLLFILLPNFDIFAQCININTCCSDNPPPAAFCSGCPPCPAVPLDGGLSALLLAGVAYGAKRIYGKGKS